MQEPTEAEIKKVLGNGQNEAPHISELKNEKAGRIILLADTIAAFSGSVSFLLLNLLWFTLWIIVNTVLAPSFHFDPYPFQFLTMSVSLEAIFLSIFVLISQNRQAAKDRIMVELDYETNRRAERENRLLIEKVNGIETHLSEMHHHLKDAVHHRGGA